MMQLNYQFIEKIKSLPFVDSVYLFGSRARGDNRPRSDIDLAIKVSEENAYNWNSIMEIIENADTLLEIDCVDLNNADEKLKGRILTQGKLLYERNPQ